VNEVNDFLEGFTGMARESRSVEDTDSVLEQLQMAVNEHERILQRQGELIKKLRDELKDVRR
jgi:uncharacterized coiled-coil protein SlyX